MRATNQTRRESRQARSFCLTHELLINISSIWCRRRPQTSHRHGKCWMVDGWW